MHAVHNAKDGLFPFVLQIINDSGRSKTVYYVLALLVYYVTTLYSSAPPGVPHNPKSPLNFKFSPNILDFPVIKCYNTNNTIPKGIKIMIKEKIDRINQLARKSKTPEGLTEAEKNEQKALRDEYIAEYRAQFTGIMENTYLQRPDGSKEKLQRKDKK